MNKKLMLLVALLSGISVVAMDHTKEMPPGKEASRNEEETLVKIWLADSSNSGTPQEVEISARLAQLMGILNELLEDPKTKDSVFPLSNMTLVEWQLIEAQLERVYGITHDEINAVQLRKEIIAEYEKLDAKGLIELIHALDYTDIPLLLELAYEVVKERNLGRFNFEQINALPGDIGNRIILDNVIRLGGPMFAKELALCRGHEHVVHSVCVTKDGKIISGSEDKTVRVWDMHGKELAICRGHEGWVSSVIVTEDRKIVSGSWWGETVRMWSMQGKELAIGREHEHWANFHRPIITKDGKIVSAGSDKTVRVWDMQDKELAVCRGHEGRVSSVCITKDGKIISGSWDETVRVWDLEGKELAICRGHDGPVFSVCVTKDDKIVSGSKDGTVGVWDMQGKLIALCSGHENTVESVCVTQDGKIVSCSWDTTIRVWDIGLLDRIVGMDEDQARALWTYVRNLSHSLDQQMFWREIEKVLGEGPPVIQAKINNNNNEG